MSDKKKVLITYTTEEYQELLKQIPKGVPISRYIREKSLEQSVILNDIKKPETSESIDPEHIAEIRDRVKQLPLMNTKLTQADANMLSYLEQIDKRLDAIVNTIKPPKKGGIFGISN